MFATCSLICLTVLRKWGFCGTSGLTKMRKYEISKVWGISFGFESRFCVPGPAKSDRARNVERGYTNLCRNLSLGNPFRGRSLFFVCLVFPNKAISVRSCRPLRLPGTAELLFLRIVGRSGQPARGWRTREALLMRTHSQFSCFSLLHIEETYMLNRTRLYVSHS